MLAATGQIAVIRTQPKPPKLVMDAEYLRSVLSYNELTGEFRWLRASNRGKLNALAGCPHNEGYITIKLDGRVYLAHRLAFMWMTGEWPKHSVDHINGIRTNNAWANLRDVTQLLNAQNRTKGTGKSGFLGVSWSKKASKWVAQIKANGNAKFLGYYQTPESAHQAYLAAKRVMHAGAIL